MSEQKKVKKLSRRNFAVALTAAPALLAQQTPPPAGAPNPNTSQPQRRGPAPEVPPFEAPIQFTRQDVPAKIQPFPMTQVKLLPSIYTEVAEWNRGYMQRLPADRLLYNFRENAGLPVGSAQPFGGWEQKANGQRGSELRGHFTGHFLSARQFPYLPVEGLRAAVKGARADPPPCNRLNQRQRLAAQGARVVDQAVVQVLHEQVVLLTIVTANEPVVPLADRVDIAQLGAGFWRVIAHYGFMETPNVPDVMRCAATQGLAVYRGRTSYFLGRETFIATGRSSLPGWRRALFMFLARNARSPTEFFGIPPNEVVELGAQIEV